MATVYAATHRNGNRVAIKLLRSSYARDPEVRARFLREGYVSNAVGHPGAVKVLDDDASEGSVFLVMELLEGESLEARRTRLGGSLPADEVFTVADKLLDVLAAAHDHGIVHRDIKPENVFVTHKGEVKVLDFGVAQMRRAGGDKTGVGLMLGTPDFMAPEQMGGHPDEIDGRSDLWSVGATLFFLLSGQPVHVATNFRDHIIATSTRQARSLAVAAPWVSPQLVDVIDRALKLEKEQRWPDAAAMQHALRRAYAAISLARTSPRHPAIPDLGAEDHGDVEKTQAQETRPWLGSDIPPPPPSSIDRTLALPPVDSDRTVALPDAGERASRPEQGRAPAQSPPPHVAAKVATSRAPAHFGGVVRTERLANIAQIAAEVTARAAQGQQAARSSAPEPAPRPPMPPVDAMAGDAISSASRQRLLILAIVLVSAIVLAFAARLAFELREPVTEPPAPGPAPSAQGSSSEPRTESTAAPAPTPSASIEPRADAAASSTDAGAAHGQSSSGGAAVDPPRRAPPRSPDRKPPTSANGPDTEPSSTAIAPPTVPFE